MSSMASASTPRQAPRRSQAYTSARVAGCDRDRVRLLDQRRGRGELPAEQVHARPVDERDGKQGECAGVPGQLHRASGERVERVVVPQLEHGHRLDDRRQQEPAHDRFVTVERLGHDRLEREPAAAARPRRVPPCTGAPGRRERGRSIAAAAAPRARLGPPRQPASTPESASTRPAYIAAPSASRYVSRANAGSSASSRLAASRRSGGPSLPRVKTNAICARSRCSSAR